MSNFRLDIKDAIKRIRSVGSLVNLNEDSNFAKIANALLSMERKRLDEAVESTKKTLSDWAGKDLDLWWGTILSIERLPGVESAEDFIGDGTYIARIKRFMQAGSQGVSLESVRMAAEAGAGIPFRVSKAGARVLLTPLEALTPATRQGALTAVHRIAPARAIIEIGEGEIYSSSSFSTMFSPSVYVGDDPSEIRASGPVWTSPNMVSVTSADKWGVAGEDTVGPGSGAPSLLMRGGTWHVPKLGFGEQTTLTVGVESEVINKVKFTISEGSWRVIAHLDGNPLFMEDFVTNGWQMFERVIEFTEGSSLTLKFFNAKQNENSLFLKGIYVGAAVDDSNREGWLAAGGDQGEAGKNVVIADPDSILNGGEWVSKPQVDPSSTVTFFAQVGGSPQVISGLKMKTRTPGALFRVHYSSDDLDREEDYPNLNWTSLPGYYKMVNGRVDVESFKAKHIRLTFTNLRPMLLKEFYVEA